MPNDTRPIERLRAALLDRYQIEEEIGRGGMAVVYRARDLKHDRTVAIKVLREELTPSVEAERFLQEVRIVAQLQHTHILTLLDSGEVERTFYFVMPFVEGESLRERLDREGELPVPDAVRYLAEIADALAYAHQNGVVHRDIKPDNVLIQGRHVVVADFGVSKALNAAQGDPQVTVAGMSLGTPTYMAPEQALGEATVDHRADIYALGVLAYELLTGHPPFRGTGQQVMAAHVTERPWPIRETRPAVPPEVTEVVERCLEKRPADRWQTAGEVAQRLEMVRTPTGGVPPLASGVIKPTEGIGKRGWKRIGFGVAGLVLTAGLAWLMGQALTQALPVVRDEDPFAAENPGQAPTSAAGSYTTETGLVVSPFENPTNDVSLDLLGRQAAYRVEQALTQAAVVQVLPLGSGAETREGDRGLSWAQERGREAGAELVVTGEVYRRGEEVEIIPRVVAAGTGRVVFNLQGARGRAEEPSAALERAAQQVAGAVASLTDPAWPFPAELVAPPPSLALYRLFQRAEPDYVQYDWTRALEVYRRITAQDTSWLTPRFREIYAAGNSGDRRSRDSIVGYLDQRRDRLTRFERASLDYALALDQGDLEAEYRAAMELYRMAPGHGIPYRPASRTNRLREALEYLTTRDTTGARLEISPTLHWVHFSVLVRLGRLEEALALARQIQESEVEGSVGLYLEAEALGILGRPEEVEALLERARAHPAATDRGRLAILILNAAARAAGKGHMEDARRYAEWILQEAEASALDMRQTRGRALAYAERWEEAEPIFRELAAESPTNDNLGWLGWVLAHTEKREESARIRTALLAEGNGHHPEPFPVSPTDGKVGFAWATAISAALGENDRALEELQQAVANGYAFDLWTVASPLFRPLYEDPRFQNFVAPR